MATHAENISIRSYSKTRRGCILCKVTEYAAPESQINVGVDDECDRNKVGFCKVSTSTVEFWSSAECHLRSSSDRSSSPSFCIHQIHLVLIAIGDLWDG